MGEKKIVFPFKQNKKTFPKMNSHLLAFNLEKARAIANEQDRFTFRGNEYVEGTWANGVRVFRRADGAFRGSRKKRKKSRKKRSRS